MYALVYDDKIQVGPRQWNYNVFMYHINEEGLDGSEFPRSAPESAIMTAGWKLLPVTIDKPGYDETYDQLSGPFLTINEDTITGYYDIVNLSFHMAVDRVKNKAAENRYEVECRGVEHTFADTSTVNVYTDRGDRSTYLDAHQTLPDGQSVTFKFKGGVFKTITKIELGELIGTGVSHVQSAFDWEKIKCDEIDIITNVEDLRLVELRHPTQIPEEE
jgi:hypothetical protein